MNSCWEILILYRWWSVETILVARCSWRGTHTILYFSTVFHGFSNFSRWNYTTEGSVPPFEQLASLISLSLAAENFTPWVNTEGRQKAESAEDTSFSVSHTTRGFLEVCQKSIKKPRCSTPGPSRYSPSSWQMMWRIARQIPETSKKTPMISVLFLENM